ncbi:HAD-IIIC family phosphatase [Thermodesulfobacteriota bacterium]
MEDLSYSQIEELLNKFDFSNYSDLNVSILRNIMVEPIEPYLRYYAYQSGLNAKIRFGEYGNIFQEAVGGRDDLFNKDTDCVIIFMYLENFSWDFARNFNSLAADQIRIEKDRIKDHIQSILNGLRGQTDAIILWLGFELPSYPSLGIWDSQIDSGQLSTVKEINEYLRETIKNTTNAYFVDTSLCVYRIGSINFYDLRYWHIGRAPYTRKALKEIAFEVYKFIRPLIGKNKKCLVLDCDNTLWGGIIGEDGIAGINLSKTYPGSAYYEFQQEIVNLYHRGIIIALCSKNNQDDVWEVFEKHPDMVLKRDHIAKALINWQDKATNLRQIALDLNIGLDSLVFVDDSDFEVNLIRQEFPSVEVIHLPKGQAIEYRKILASYGLFDTLTVTTEDKKRGALYNAEEERKKLRAETTDLVSYYRSLEMELEISFADEFSIPRIAQQTQRTNQFNLTTRRYNEADIKHFIDDSDADVLYLRLRDKVGDSGIVGTCILKYNNNKSIFDTFLLSCRVLGRGAEDAFIIQALKLAKKRNCKLAVGEYYATKKNSQVEDFYTKQGFKEMNAENEKADRVFYFELGNELQAEPSYFKEIRSEIQKIGE